MVLQMVTKLAVQQMRNEDGLFIFRVQLIEVLGMSPRDSTLV